MVAYLAYFKTNNTLGQKDLGQPYIAQLSGEKDNCVISLWKSTECTFNNYAVLLMQRFGATDRIFSVNCLGSSYVFNT